jgi:hypothetical protein
MEPGAWDYNRTHLLLGYINTETWSSRFGGWTNYSLKNFIVSKSKEGETRCNLTESSMEGCGSKIAVLPVIMMMIFTLQMIKGWSYI